MLLERPLPHRFPIWIPTVAPILHSRKTVGPSRNYAPVADEDYRNSFSIEMGDESLPHFRSPWSMIRSRLGTRVSASKTLTKKNPRKPRTVSTASVPFPSSSRNRRMQAWSEVNSTWMLLSRRVFGPDFSASQSVHKKITLRQLMSHRAASA